MEPSPLSGIRLSTTEFRSMGNGLPEEGRAMVSVKRMTEPSWSQLGSMEKILFIVWGDSDASVVTEEDRGEVHTYNWKKSYHPFSKVGASLVRGTGWGWAYSLWTCRFASDCAHEVWIESHRKVLIQLKSKNRKMGREHVGIENEWRLSNWASPRHAKATITPAYISVIPSVE